MQYMLGGSETLGSLVVTLAARWFIIQLADRQGLGAALETTVVRIELEDLRNNVADYGVPRAV